VLRVSCQWCDRIVEVETVDTVCLYGAHAIWKDAGGRILDNTCQHGPAAMGTTDVDRFDGPYAKASHGILPRRARERQGFVFRR
jgi:hypothetical protein